MARLEATLLIGDGAVSARRLAQLATLADAAETRTLIERLNEAYDRTNSAFRIEQVATGYQMLTRPEFSFWLDRLHRRHATLKLSPPGMETLAIIVYRQPITRADIEAIRGVQCTEMLKMLMERGLVRIAGEEDSLGRPYLYETTRKFLELFGLRGLDSLPMADRLRTKNSPAPPAPPQAGDSETVVADQAASPTETAGESSAALLTSPQAGDSETVMPDQAASPAETADHAADDDHSVHSAA